MYVHRACSVIWILGDDMKTDVFSKVRSAFGNIGDVNPPIDDGGGRGRNDKWNDTIFNQLENLQWMIETKHWQDTINIEKHLVDRLRNIPESYIRFVVDTLMNDDDPPRVTKYIIRGS